MELPIIETPRLVLTAPTSTDAERMLNFVITNQMHLAAWEPTRIESYYTHSYWEAMLAAYEAEWIQGKSLRLILLDRSNITGEIVGLCNFSNIIRGVFQAAHLGYSLDQQAVGKGLMYEALSAALPYVFTQLNLHRIMANYIPTNQRSGQLLRRLDFTVEGYAYDYLFLGGQWQDHILTALINPNWQEE